MTHIFDQDLEQVIFTTTRDDAAADHFIKGANLAFKFAKTLSGMLIHTHRHIDRQRIAQCGRVGVCMIACDDAKLFKPFDTADGGCGGQVDDLADLADGCSCIVCQTPSNLTIDTIECHDVLGGCHN